MTTDWGVLQRAIEGDVVLPGSADYESATSLFRSGQAMTRRGRR